MTTKQWLVIAVGVSVLGSCSKQTEPTPGQKKNQSSTAATANEARPAASAAADIPAPPDVSAPPADAMRTASGLASKVLQAGTSKEHPAEWDRVTVHYTGGPPTAKCSTAR